MTREGEGSEQGQVERDNRAMQPHLLSKGSNAEEHKLFTDLENICFIVKTAFNQATFHADNQPVMEM